MARSSIRSVIPGWHRLWVGLRESFQRKQHDKQPLLIGLGVVSSMTMLQNHTQATDSAACPFMIVSRFRC